MLILLLLFALFHHLQGAPLFDSQSATTPASPADSSPLISRSHIKFGTRTEADIIISCLATIFACTWTAIHPNIPSPTDSGFDTFKRRARVTFFALLAPEAITTFALRQRLAASDIATKYNTWAEEQMRETSSHTTTSASHPQTGQGRASTTHGTDKLETVGDSSAADPSSVQVTPVQGPAKPSRFSVLIAYARQQRWIMWLPRLVMGWFHRPTLAERPEGQIERWTTTHGFFLQMGGYMLSKNGMPRFTIRTREAGYASHIISNAGIQDLIAGGKISAPTTTKADIQDRSKGDVISKTVVILQTTWFLAQCIARWSTGLAVTELEVITLGFVALNGLTYAFWWNKPQNVGVPVYLEWVSPEAPPAPPTDLTKQSFIYTRFRKLIDEGYDAVGDTLELLASPFVPIALLLTGRTYGQRISLRVSMFYSADSPGSEGNSLPLLMSVVAVLFGAVHLAPAWFLSFPSQLDRIIWRICAIVTTAVPISAVPLLSALEKAKSDFIKYTAAIPIIIFALFYVISRIALFVLAFISFRNLPDDALTTIEWLSIFPHI